MLRSLVLVVAVAVAVAVGYLVFLSAPADIAPQQSIAKDVGDDRLVTAAKEPEPELTTEVLQQVLPPERIESPPDGHDEPALPLETPSPVVSANPLPKLNESDGRFRGDLLGLDPTTLLADLLIDEELIRKFVVVVDNMAEGRIPRKHSLLRLPAEKFIASESEGQVWLDGVNYGRYDAYMTLLSALGPEQLAKLYRRYYPLMQEAYAELGYPRRSFHRRLLDAMDHLLLSPQIDGALQLEQPSVMYKFADKALEQLSDVHKQMLRLGPENAEKVRQKVVALRRLLQE